MTRSHNSSNVTLGICLAQKNDNSSLKHPIIFTGKQLTPMGNIESPPSNYACSLYSSTDETADENKVIFKQYSDLINISCTIDFDMRAYNLQGQLLSSLQSQNQQLDWVHNLSDQIVILQIIMGNQITSKKVFIY